MSTTCSVGIMAHNEEPNIGLLLKALGRQRLDGVILLETIVVASGCTDRTEAIVRECAAADPRIRLIVQERREGKASAVNLFLAEARGEILVLESADTLPRRDTLERLLAPFADPAVGMTGVRPRPVNSGPGLMDYSAHFFWWMHHNLALFKPKLGEMVAFRRFVRSIPPDSAVDEASIESIVQRAGYRIHYALDSIVFNRGPMNLREYLMQRRRITAGHLHLRSTRGYVVASRRYGLVLSNLALKARDNLRLLGRLVRRRQKRFLVLYFQHYVRRALYLPAAVLMEIVGQAMGACDYYVRGRNPYIWPMASSTKRLR